jgi:hypothetical protein
MHLDRFLIALCICRRDGCARIASRRPGQLHRHDAVAPETRAMRYPRQAPDLLYIDAIEIASSYAVRHSYTARLRRGQSWFRLSFPDAIEVASGWVSLCVPA